MVSSRSWLPRSEEILGVLRKQKIEFFERAQVEELFQLQRRAAINLLKSAGAKDRGGSLRIPRTTLIQWVTRIAKEETPSARQEMQQGDLTQDIAQLRATLIATGRQPISFPLTMEVLTSRFSSLPPEISIGVGRITIEASSEDPAHAVELLFHLAKAIANEPETFCKLILKPNRTEPSEEAIEAAYYATFKAHA